jgi:hypothetical protein
MLDVIPADFVMSEFWIDQLRKRALACKARLLAALAEADDETLRTADEHFERMLEKVFYDLCVDMLTTHGALIRDEYERT